MFPASRGAEFEEITVTFFMQLLNTIKIPDRIGKRDLRSWIYFFAVR